MFCCEGHVHSSHQLCWGPIVHLSRLINKFPKEGITIPTTKDKDILPMNSKKNIPTMTIFRAGYIQQIIVNHCAKCPDCTHPTWTNSCDDVSHNIVNRSQKLVHAGEIASQMAPKTLPSLKLTCLPLKIDGWKIIIAFWKACVQGRTVSFQEDIHQEDIHLCNFALISPTWISLQMKLPGLKRNSLSVTSCDVITIFNQTCIHICKHIHTYVYIYIYIYTYDYISSHNLNTY